MIARRDLLDGALIGALVLGLATCGKSEAFTPCAPVETAVRVALIESYTPSLTCGAIALDMNEHVEAFLIAASGTPACAVWTAERAWIVTLPSADDAIVAHELRHALDAGYRHVPGLPLELSCAR